MSNEWNSYQYPSEIIPHIQRQMAMSEALPCCQATVLQLRAWLRKGNVSSKFKLPFFTFIALFLHIFHVLTVNYFHNPFTISQICVSAWIKCTDFTNLGWFSWLHRFFEVELIWFHLFPSIILMVEKSGWIRIDNKDLLKNQQITNNTQHGKRAPCRYCMYCLR